jgi:hypothetical protein
MITIQCHLLQGSLSRRAGTSVRTVCPVPPVTPSRPTSASAALTVASLVRDLDREREAAENRYGYVFSTGEAAVRLARRAKPGRNRGRVSAVGDTVSVTLALEIVVTVLVSIPLAVVLYVFVWAARKDGEEDRALQRRLGIRRRTRLGR